jgi:hypothetical protein
MSESGHIDISDARRNELGSVNDALLVREMPEGTKIRLRNGAVAEVTGNPRDGGWLLVKFLEHENPEKVGTDDMVFCIDVVALAN